MVDIPQFQWQVMSLIALLKAHAELIMQIFDSGCDLFQPRVKGRHLLAIRCVIDDGLGQLGDLFGVGLDLGKLVFLLLSESLALRQFLKIQLGDVELDHFFIEFKVRVSDLVATFGRLALELFIQVRPDNMPGKHRLLKQQAFESAFFALITFSKEESPGRGEAQQLNTLHK